MSRLCIAAEQSGPSTNQPLSRQKLRMDGSTEQAPTAAASSQNEAAREAENPILEDAQKAVAPGLQETPTPSGRGMSGSLNDRASSTKATHIEQGKTEAQQPGMSSPGTETLGDPKPQSANEGDVQPQSVTDKSDPLRIRQATGSQLILSFHLTCPCKTPL